MQIMNTDLLFAGLNNLFLCLLCIGISIPLLKNKIGMNRWYGVRIPKSYVSTDNWMQINRYGARAMIYWSIPVGLIGLVMVIVSLFIEKSTPIGNSWIISLSLAGLLILGALIQTLIWSRKLPSKIQT